MTRHDSSDIFFLQEINHEKESGNRIFSVRGSPSVRISRKPEQFRSVCPYDTTKRLSKPNRSNNSKTSKKSLEDEKNKTFNKTSSNKTSSNSDRIASDKISSGKTSSGHTSSGYTSSGHTSSGHTPSGHTSADRIPSYETSSNERPSEEIPEPEEPTHYEETSSNYDLPAYEGSREPDVSPGRGKEEDLNVDVPPIQMRRNPLTGDGIAFDVQRRMKKDVNRKKDIWAMDW